MKWARRAFDCAIHSYMSSQGTTELHAKLLLLGEGEMLKGCCAHPLLPSKPCSALSSYSHFTAALLQAELCAAVLFHSHGSASSFLFQALCLRREQLLRSSNCRFPEPLQAMHISICALLQFQLFAQLFLSTSFQFALPCVFEIPLVSNPPRSRFSEHALNKLYGLSLE